MKRKPVGVDDFKHIVENDLFFVDKTMFIKEIIDNGSLVILIARPRRFGKTLNMSLLRYFFEKTDEDTSQMFKDYNIWQQGEDYTKEQGKYPVINLTFKDVKMKTWHSNYRMLQINIADEFARHIYLLDSDAVTKRDKDRILMISNNQGEPEDYIKSLELLSRALYLHHNKKAVILLDEYDTLLNEAYISGHWQEAIEFMRPFMNAGFKNNKYLHKAVLTGIFRVAKESIFSDMNNLSVCTMVSDKYRDCFGFTQKEVEQILLYFNINEKIQSVAQWYNGYLFGKTEFSIIYNPWSIMMYANEGNLGPYWVNTSGNEIIKKLATESSNEVQYSIQDIIEGGTIDRIKIDENIIYSEITKSESSIWSFMLMSGYLKSIKTELEEDGIYCTLKAPNKEVFYFFRNILESWLDETIKGGSVQSMLKALLTGDVDTFHEIFATTIEKSVSYFDVADDKSESFYHAFVMGLLVYLDKEYYIKSNRESGHGRYDVMIIPMDKSKKGIIIEFKKASKLKGETVEQALAAALTQLEEKKYETELLNSGIKDVVRLGIGFKGKDVRIGTV